MEILDDIDGSKKIDRENMLSKAESLPEMLEEGWKLAHGAKIPNIVTFDNVVVSGMGGSAISGDIASFAFNEKIKVPVVVNRSYDAPEFCSERTLFIAVSYSGNTEETLSALDKAVNKRCKILTISSGGKLESISKSSNLPHIKIPSGLPPRAALGYILPSLLHIFSSAKMANEIEENLLESIDLLKKLKSKYSINEPLKSNIVKQMAKKMQGKVPIILSCIDLTYPAGLRFKTQLNENSKMTALHITFPELDHNDLVNISFLKPGEHDFFALMLRDSFISGRMTRRIEVTKSLVSANLKGFNEVWTQGRSKLARILSLVFYGDLLSVYMAILNNVDPTPVSIIEQLKKELAR